MPESHILVVEDEVSIRDMLEFTLTLEGFAIELTSSTVDAKHAIAKRTPDLILLDWMLPGQSGVSFATYLKSQEKTANVPIIMLTARTDEDDKVRSFDVGVDDYVTKPFSPRELCARIRAVLRRGSAAKLAQESLRAQCDRHQVVLDVEAHQASVDGQILPLRPIEYRLLQFFLQNKGRVYSREQLLEKVWGNEAYVDDRTVDVQIRRLRKALAGQNCAHLIETVRGAGYKLVEHRS